MENSKKKKNNKCPNCGSKDKWVLYSGGVGPVCDNCGYSPYGNHKPGFEAYNKNKLNNK